MFRRRSEARLADLGVRLEEVEARLHDERAQKGVVAERLALLERRVAADRERVEHRIGEVGTVVATQFGELSGELDAVARRLRELAAATASTAEQVAVLESLHGERLVVLEARVDKAEPVSLTHLHELRQHQIALANELARYEIALRNDLAAAIERLGTRR